LPLFANVCDESPDRELSPDKSASIDDRKNRSDAAVCGDHPPLDDSKRQGKGKV